MTRLARRPRIVAAASRLGFLEELVAPHRMAEAVNCRETRIRAALPGESSKQRIVSFATVPAEELTDRSSYSLKSHRADQPWRSAQPGTSRCAT
jgi:hypothetical protein